MGLAAYSMVRTRSNSSFVGSSLVRFGRTWARPNGSTMALYRRCSSTMLMATLAVDPTPPRPIKIETVKFRLGAEGIEVEVTDHPACSLGNDEERVGRFMTVRDALCDRRGSVRLIDRRLKGRRIHQSGVLGWHGLPPDNGNCFSISLRSIANHYISSHGQDANDVGLDMPQSGICDTRRRTPRHRGRPDAHA